MADSNFPQVFFQQLLEKADTGLKKNVSYQIAVCYRSGRGTELDEVKATKYFKRSARAGHVLGSEAYAQRLLKGIGTKKKIKKAVKLLYQLLESGQDDSLEWSVDNYFLELIDGDEVNEEFFNFLLDYAQTSKNGNSQYHVACCYQKGKGTEVDEVQATEFFQLSSQKGHLLGSEAYAHRLMNGIGTEKNVKKAALIYRDLISKGRDNLNSLLDDCLNELYNHKEITQEEMLTFHQCKLVEPLPLSFPSPSDENILYTHSTSPSSQLLIHSNSIVNSSKQPSEIQVQVQISYGEVVRISVQSSQRIRVIQSKLRLVFSNTSKIYCHFQEIFLFQTFDQTDITSDSLITVLENPIRLFFRTDYREEFVIITELSISVLFLKEMIQSQYSIPLNKQNLFFDHELLENQKILSQYSIVNGSLILLRERFPEIVEPEFSYEDLFSIAEISPLPISPNDTIYNYLLDSNFAPAPHL